MSKNREGGIIIIVPEEQAAVGEWLKNVANTQATEQTKAEEIADSLIAYFGNTPEYQDFRKALIAAAKSGMEYAR